MVIHSWHWGEISNHIDMTEVRKNPNRWSKEGLLLNKALTVGIMDLIDREAWSLLMADDRICVKPVFHDITII